MEIDADIRRYISREVRDIVDIAISTRSKVSIPLTLYHYTTSVGLIGIIESDSIWATSVEFLSDPNLYTQKG
jgi:hypothetical protein